MASPVAIFCCNPEEALYASLAEICEREWEEHDLEMTLAEDASLFAREPEFWEERAATDPWWPPPAVDPFEVAFGGDHG